MEKHRVIVTTESPINLGCLCQDATEDDLVKSDKTDSGPKQWGQTTWRNLDIYFVNSVELPVFCSILINDCLQLLTNLLSIFNIKHTLLEMTNKSDRVKCQVVEKNFKDRERDKLN